MDHTAAVQQRYGAAAQAVEPSLCCPVTYNPSYLAAIPHEILERDYGCGDPSRFVRAGETVLDLGSGSGKICYIASQIVGAHGQVIGVDRNREMLQLARSAQAAVAQSLGFKNVSFRCGQIQDLALDLEALDLWLSAHPVHNREDLFALHQEESRLRKEQPLIPDDSMDVVISNCVLNLIDEHQRQQLFSELYRVTKVGGRVAISDIVADEDVPDQQQQDPRLWSGCMSGAFREDRFLDAFVAAGFHGVCLAKREERPWQVVNGIEYRSVTVVAYKGKQGPCLEGNHAIIYPGPWSEVHDDDGHKYKRGKRTAVCAKTYRLLTSGPYSDQVIGLPPYKEIPNADQQPYSCGADRERHPQETKNGELTTQWHSANGACAPDSACC